MQNESKLVGTIIPPIDKIKKGDTFELYGKKGKVLRVNDSITTNFIFGKFSITESKIITVEVITMEPELSKGGAE